WTITIAPPSVAAVASPQVEIFRRVSEVSALVLCAVALSGTMVRAVGASWACGTAFPDCNGLGAMPFGREPLADIQLYHRLLAYVALGLVTWLTVEAFRTQRGLAGVVPASIALLGLTVVDGAIGALRVSMEAPLLTVAHQAATLATWSAAVGLVV